MSVWGFVHMSAVLFRGQRWRSVRYRSPWAASHGCCRLNSGPLEEQNVSVTTEPALEPQVCFVFFCFDTRSSYVALTGLEFALRSRLVQIYRESPVSTTRCWNKGVGHHFPLSFLSSIFSKTSDQSRLSAWLVLENQISADLISRIFPIQVVFWS